MVDQHSVRRHELQSLHVALSEQEPVEWVVRRGCRLSDLHDVQHVYRKNTKARRDEKSGDILELHSRVKLAEPRLDGNFPKACDTGKRSDPFCEQQAGDGRKTPLEIASSTESNMCVSSKHWTLIAPA